MLLHLSKKNWKAYKPEKNCKWRWWGSWRHQHIRSTNPHGPFLLVSAELVVTLPPVDFLPLGWASIPLFKWGLLAEDAPLDPGTGLFLHGGLLLNLCQRPVNMALQASLTRRNHIPETVKKRELWSLDLMMLPGNRIKHMCWNMSWVPNSFVQNVMNLETKFMYFWYRYNSSLRIR